jgi:alpha-methylacyl-CoA racemase
VVLELAGRADVIIEGFRPGVAERLGIGPEECRSRNPRLVYGRMTGWGQTGPLAARAGHDVDYLALSGALHAIGPEGGPPVIPLNLIGDFGGGGMMLAFGLVAALLERERSGLGQVIDAAMVEGVGLLTTMFHGLLAVGRWSEARGANLLDGGAPFYDVYETADGRFVAVGALEPQFYDELLVGLGLDPGALPDRMDRPRWPELRHRLAEAFASRTRDEWEEVFAQSDGCVSPVLSMSEARHHRHAVARRAFLDVGGLAQPAPAPRFDRTPAEAPAPPPHPGQHTDEVLGEAGVSRDEVAALRSAGAIA